MHVEDIQDFVKYARGLSGDEKGEAQVFCDRLFKAFGHDGYKEAGATLEFRIKRRKRTQYADLVWKPRLLLEMKRKGEPLHKHYSQVFEYWLHSVPRRPRYVVLCNFDEFWIYDFDAQLQEPVDRVSLDDLAKRYTALNFLFPDDPPPQFGNDKVAVTRTAAAKVAAVFHSLVHRGEAREDAQRFVLQCVVAMFSEDIGLLPRGIFTQLVSDSDSGGSSYDLIGGLFQQMNRGKPARGGRYRSVPYFNGGIFAQPQSVELTKNELAALGLAAQEDWSRIEPAIFGTLFQQSMDADERHAYGAYYTSEAEIQRVVRPSIVRPWQAKIEAAKTAKELMALRSELLAYRVLDPACGSGNFLYVAYRELKRLEFKIVSLLHEYGSRTRSRVATVSFLSPRQFFGIDKVPFAAELAKVTLMLGKKLAIDEGQELAELGQLTLPLDAGEAALPLDNLDDCIICDDALTCDWPAADVVIGNPPYQSKNKMQRELGAEYVQGLRSRYPGVPGRADYAVYWFRRAHDHLPKGGHAGLVGTNTIRQTYSREGGLQYIVDNGGVIIEAVSSQVWPGDAVVNVSIVNWVKGKQKGKKKLFEQLGDDVDSPWRVTNCDVIPPSLSARVDVGGAQSLATNKKPKRCFQGQTPGHDAFLMTADEVKAIERGSRKHVKKYLVGEDLLGQAGSHPTRYVIDLHPLDQVQASRHAKLFKRIKDKVLPDRELAAKEERRRNQRLRQSRPTAKGNRHHEGFLNRWWQLSYPRPKLLEALSKLSRYIVCVRVTRRPIFEFVTASVRPGDALSVFPFEDDYSFGVLQSSVHWEWFVERCSTLKRDYRYTSSTVFDSFPWPQAPTGPQVAKVAEAAVELRTFRRSLMNEEGISLRELYRALDTPGTHPLKDAHARLDRAVRRAYGMKRGENTLSFLLDLNQRIASREQAGKSVVAPGGAGVGIQGEYVTDDCVG